MNKQRLQKIADVLRGKESAPKDGRKTIFFNMETFGNRFHEGFNVKTGRQNSCGTAACIAGYAVAMFSGEKFAQYVEGPRDADVDGRKLLELDSETADRLFYCCESLVDMEDIKPAQAADVIENLIETGKVDWGIID